MEKYNAVVTTLETFSSLFDYSLFAGSCLPPSLFLFNKTGNITDFCNAGINSIYDPFVYTYPAFRATEILAPNPHGGGSVIEKDVICGFPTNVDKAKRGACGDSLNNNTMRMCPCDQKCQKSV
jgi:hypothetical protein